MKKTQKLKIFDITRLLDNEQEKRPIRSSGGPSQQRVVGYVFLGAFIGESLRNNDAAVRDIAGIYSLFLYMARMVVLSAAWELGVA